MEKKDIFDQAFYLSRRGFVFITGNKKNLAAYYLFNFKGELPDLLLAVDWPDVCDKPLFIIAHPQIEKMKIWQILSAVQSSLEHQPFFGHTAPGFLQDGQTEIFAIGTLYTGYLICELKIVCGDNSPLFLPFGNSSIRRSIFKPANNEDLDGLIYLLVGWNPLSHNGLKLNYFKSQNDSDNVC